MKMTLVKWPIIEEDDIQAVLNVLKNGALVKGPNSKILEDEFARYIGSPYCKSVSSCTHAIHLALRALGIGPGDEVLVPNLTYCGSVSPIVNTGAKPVFVDVSKWNYNLCLKDAVAKRTSRTKAVIPVHLHGYPCDIDALSIALPDLFIIEDACQAHGARRGRNFAGTLGDIGCFSLNQVKPLCGGQGGLIVTKDAAIWENICEFASAGQGTTVGLSYEITEMAAALALSQLHKLEIILQKANANYHVFQKALLEKLQTMVSLSEENVRPTWHKVRLKTDIGSRDKLLGIFHSSGVPYELWPGTLVSERSEYSTYLANTPVAKEIMHTSFILGNEAYPFHAQPETTILEWATIINESLK